MDAKAYARAPPENSKTVEKVYIDVIQKDEKELLHGQEAMHISPEAQKIFNVLLLGEAQSGKSTFIEYVKKYADPDYTINLSNVGNGISSCTKEVIRSTVHTDLPITDVIENASGSCPTEVYLGSLINDWPDLDDFEGVLNRTNLKTVRTQSSESPTQYQFNLFDTPGLNDTHGEDEAHVASIYKALRDAGHIHLVLVTIGRAPFTPGFQAAIKCYFDMLPEFHGLAAFVHTHVDYKDLHSGWNGAASHLTANIALLRDMMGRDSCPHFVMDCDLETTRPIRDCIIQNTIHNILYLASSNKPVAVGRIQIYKSPKMRDIDSILASKYKATAAMIAARMLNHGTHASIRSKLFEIETNLNEIYSDECTMRLGRLQQLKRVQEKYRSEHESGQASLQKLVDLNKLRTLLISRLLSKTLALEVLDKLVERKAYTNAPSENVVAVEEIYLDTIQDEGILEESSFNAETFVRSGFKVGSRAGQNFIVRPSDNLKGELDREFSSTISDLLASILKIYPPQLRTSIVSIIRGPYRGPRRKITPK
ncbi:hypothetical protein BGX26_010188 [Mortierella sp. AD094]|nr:hypothetical protein BGX26_010188 [Mortierella sp. AD094]